MGNQRYPKVYIGYHVLSLLAKNSLEDDRMSREREAMRNIWEHHKRDRLRLVTSGEDMELEMVLAFNDQGCCITDTCMVTEHIEAFETWDKVDGVLTEEWKQVIELFDQLEILAQQCDESRGTNDGLLSFIRDAVMCAGESDVSPVNLNDHEFEVLHGCAERLQEWYREDAWRNLRRIEYELNWKILESELLKRSLKPVFEGRDGEQNRFLLGLLNRVVGFSKKSCPNLPMSREHIDFVVKAVMKKYRGNRHDHAVRHIVHCIGHGVDFLITIDDDLIERFNGKRHELLKHPDCGTMKLELIRPSELEIKLKKT